MSSNETNNQQQQQQQQAGPGHSGTGSILDVIFEKTANIESSTNVQNVKLFVAEALRTQAVKEGLLRESTITVKQHQNVLEHDRIVSLIESLLERKEQLPATFWQDKDSTYCQFDSRSTKELIIDLLNSESDMVDLKINLFTFKPGVHFQRKPAKIEIPNARSNIKLERIKEILELATSANDPITDLREGKPHQLTKSRSIMFKASAFNLKQLFIELDGVLPYSNRATNTRAKLYMKINVKPWQCRDCHKFGQHQCLGKRCTNCCTQGHAAKECKQKTKYCDNCRQRGHRAKDVHCRAYLTEVAKEIRKIDLPIVFYTDKQFRMSLAKHLQLK